MRKKIFPQPFLKLVTNFTTFMYVPLIVVFQERGILIGKGCLVLLEGLDIRGGLQLNLSGLKLVGGLELPPRSGVNLLPLQIT